MVGASPSAVFGLAEARVCCGFMRPTPVQPRYRGSPLHKRYPMPDGTAPRLGRSDKSECPSEISYEVATQVLLAGITGALARGYMSQLAQNGWPRYVWGRSTFPTRDGQHAEIVWEAMRTSDGLYKASPCQRERHSDLMPDHVEEALWPDD